MKAEAVSGTPSIPLTNFKQRVIAATGISENSYKRIVKEAHSVEEGTSASFSSPRKNRPKKCTKSNLPVYEEAEIRRLVNNFYIYEKRRPTIKGVLSKLHECNVPFTGSKTTLRTLLMKIGFR